MPIRIFNCQKRVPMRFSAGSGFAKSCVAPLEKKLRLKKGVEYNIIFVDDGEITALNERFLSRSRPTDVITFNYPGGSADIFISVETAKSNSVFYRSGFKEEIFRLIVHGVLHALGYCDYTQKDREKMWIKQEGLVKCIIS